MSVGLSPSPRSTPEASGLPEAMGKGPTHPPLVLVTGGKGGVGKTTVAANLGLALHAAGSAPLLVDLDLSLANLDVVLGVQPTHTTEDYLAGDATLEECLWRDERGLRLLAAGSGSYDMGRPDAERRARLRSALDGVDADLLVGDSPAGIGADVLDFAVTAQRVLVVTTPEPAAFTDAYGLIKALDAYARDQGTEVPTPEVFVNFAADLEEARGVAAKMAELCERFLARSPRFAGWMPRSEAVQRSGISQAPFVESAPRSLATHCVERLARRLSWLGQPPQLAAAAHASSNHGR